MFRRFEDDHLFLSQVVDATFDDLVPLAQARMPEYFGIKSVVFTINIINLNFKKDKPFNK